MDGRYDRQIRMPEIGTEGQRKLEQSVVTVIGCGGLGGAGSYLPCAGRRGDSPHCRWRHRLNIKSEPAVSPLGRRYRKGEGTFSGGKAEETESADPCGDVSVLSDRGQCGSDPFRLGCGGGLRGQPCGKASCGKAVPCQGHPARRGALSRGFTGTCWTSPARRPAWSVSDITWGKALRRFRPSGLWPV